MIVVAGEALIDLVADDAGALRSHVGGGPFNVARTIGRLEQPVRYLGPLSDDRYGTALRDALHADGVELALAQATPLPTTLALAEIDEDGGARYRFYSAGTSATALGAQEAIGALAPAPATLLVGGLALALDPVGTALEAAIGALPATALLALDPNCRPAAIAEPDAYRARIDRVLRRTDLVKASVEDLDYLFPGRDPLDSARRLVAGTPAAVVVTRGADGAIVIGPHAEIAVAAPAVAVVDTIGAGDAFVGALLAWWSQRGLGRAALGDMAMLTDAARFAASVAAITCARAGASPPRRAELPPAD
jgi:fructokinase